MKTYGDKLTLQYPVIFLMLNENIPEGEIADLVANKKNKLRSYQEVMTLNQLKRFCEEKIPFELK